MVCGYENDYFNQGKVLIAAANPDMMEYYISEHDLVILATATSPSCVPSRWRQTASLFVRVPQFP